MLQIKSIVVIASRYFNQLHKGHLENFIKAKTKGNLLCVIVNSHHHPDLIGSKEF